MPHRSIPPSQVHRASILPATLLGLMKARADATDVPQLGAAVEGPHTGCVRLFPTLSPDTVQVVAFDSRGIARLRIEMARGEDLEAWERWLLRWLRRKYPDARADMKVVR